MKIADEADDSSAATEDTLRVALPALAEPDNGANEIEMSAV